MINKIEFLVDGVDYTVKLASKMYIEFRATVEDTEVDGTWWDDERYYDTTELTGNTKHPLKVYSKIAETVRNIIYSNRLQVYCFSVGDERRAAIYERFAKTLKGYTYQRIDKLFYLFKED